MINLAINGKHKSGNELQTRPIIYCKKTHQIGKSIDLDKRQNIA